MKLNVAWLFLILKSCWSQELMDNEDVGSNNDTSCEISGNCTEIEITSLIPDSTVESVTVPISNSTTTAVPPQPSGTNKTKKPKKAKEFEKENDCFCDLTVSRCDINCCCDTDCSKLHFELFTKCLEPSETSINMKFCNAQKSIWKNHTNYKMEITSNGLFCIVRNNLPERIFRNKQKDFSNYASVTNAIENHHQWSKTDLKKKAKILTKYRKGVPLMLIKNNSISHLEFPTSMVTNDCLAVTKVKFLKDMETTCLADNIKPDYFTISSMYERLIHNQYIISSSELFNITWLNKISDCPFNVCIPILVQICDNFFINCLPFDERNTSSIIKKIISPVVSKIKYEILYNVSIAGITKAFAYFAIKNTREPFLQTFQVSFREENQSLDYSLIRGGNPGYSEGKYILLAEIGSINSTSNSTPQLLISKDITKNILTIPVSIEGICVSDNLNHRKIKFGVNVFSSCLFKPKFNVINESNYCLNVQNQIWKMWQIFNETDKSIKNGLFFGNNGNANRSILNEWTSVLLDKSTVITQEIEDFQVKCISLITKLQINILFARKTSRDLSSNAQILGIYYKFLDSSQINLKINGDNFVGQFNLMTQVFHHDFTNYNYDKIEFASAPTFDFHLPNDFFYPFQSSQTSTIFNVKKIFLILAAYALINI